MNPRGTRYPTALFLACLLAGAGCQYGDDARPVAPFGDATLGMYARIVQSGHALSDLGVDGLRRVLVTRVAPGGPADRAGIRPGAYLVSVDGHNCRDAESLIRLVRSLNTDEEVVVTIYQDGKKSKLKLRPMKNLKVWGDTPHTVFEDVPPAGAPLAGEGEGENP